MLQSIAKALSNFANRNDASRIRKIAEAVKSSVLFGSATYDAASLVDGAGATGTVTVAGAALGDFAEVSFGVSLQGITCTAFVSAADTVSFRLQNETAGTIDLASTTVRALVRKASAFDAETAFNLRA